MKQILFNGNKNIISELLIDAREKLNITQTDLAAKMQVLNINMDQQMISKIEKNQRQVTDYEFAAFCVCLKIPAQKILDAFSEKSK